MVKQLYYGRFPEDSPVPPYFHKPQQQFQYVHLPVDKLGLDSQFLFLVECGPAPLDGESAKLRALRAMRACVPDACFMSFSAC